MSQNCGCLRLRAEFVEDEDERGKWLTDLEELDQIADSAIRLVREEASSDGVATVHLDGLLTEITTELEETGLRVTQREMVALDVAAGSLALKRALRNLIVNAATHGGGAEISLTRASGKALITIRDKGPGIPDELLSQVFEPFFRVDPSRRKTMPGVGLGLAIAREIVERFGGEITIRNLPAGGLIQEVRMPAQGLTA